MAIPALRLFVSIQPAAVVSLPLLAMVDADVLPEAQTAPMRPLSPEGLYLTLAFLGDRHKKELPGIHESIERACAGVRPFTLTVDRIMTLPRRQVARMVAAVTDEPSGLMELHRRLVSRLIKPVQREKRVTAFLPHITLARYEPGTMPESFEKVLEEDARVRIEVASIDLVVGLLGPNGSEHQIARTFPLSGR